MYNNGGEIFQIGDAVYYCGTSERLKASLSSKDGKPCKGWIHAPVLNDPTEWVVEFLDIKGYPSYVLSERDLSKAKFAKEGPEVQPRRQKPEED